MGFEHDALFFEGFALFGCEFAVFVANHEDGARGGVLDVVGEGGGAIGATGRAGLLGILVVFLTLLDDVFDILGLLDDDKALGRAEGELLGVGHNLINGGVPAIEHRLVEVALFGLNDKVLKEIADAVDIERFLAHQEIDGLELFGFEVFY